MNPAASALFEEAAQLHRQGAWAEAAERYRRILHDDPSNTDALYHLARLACQQGRLADGVELARRMLSIEPKRGRAHLLLGMAMAGLGRPQEALTGFDAAIACQPDLADAYGGRGDVLSALGRLQEALESYDDALRLAPDSIDNLCNRGAVLVDLGRMQEALAVYDHLIALDQRFPEAYFNRGHIFETLGRDQDALVAYEAALALRPDYPDALNNRGNVLRRLGRTAEALASFERAIAITSDHVPAHVSHGGVLRSLGQHAQALAAYERALAALPDCVDALMGRGAALIELNRPEDALGAFDSVLAFDPANTDAASNRAFVLNTLNRHADALASCDRALAMAPGHADALNNRGVALTSLGRAAEAVACFDDILSRAPAHVGALRNRAVALTKLRRYDEAIAAHERVLAIDPGHPRTLGDLADCCAAICDWSRTARFAAQLTTRMSADRLIVSPFVMLRMTDDPALLLECARRHVAQEVPNAFAPARGAPARGGGKIRVAYLSADFHRHATAYLAAGLFELHDRGRFEIIGISFGPNDNSAMRARLEQAFDRFIDVSARSDRDVAALLRELEIDIAVDLKGHTEAARFGIFAERAAPIQVSYLGYPGTTGADFIDYVIADPIVVPMSQQSFYSERIVHLPDSYQVNDSRRARPLHAPPRIELGLPERGFVFCCFNQAWKIDERLFDIWMRLLSGIDGSVLWLFQTNAFATRNLRKEAQTRGVAPERLVFAPLVDLDEHLARLTHADLFLDTLPYNAHTTASDALWAGVPVVTTKGASFAGRVAASLLHATGLPELVTESLADYEMLARGLARDPVRLNELRQKLQRQGTSHPLYDTDRFRRHVEAAYVTMWEAWQRGESPRSFRVEPIDA